MAYLCSTMSGASNGETSVGGSDLNGWGLESSEAFFLHTAGACAMMNPRLGSGETAEHLHVASPFLPPLSLMLST